MSKELLIELIVTGVLLSLLVIVLNPMNLWMPPQTVMILLAFLLIVFILFAVFIWKEHSQDERENLHKLMAGRIGFLAGATMLVAGIIVQELKHALDPWLIISLGIMVLGKILSSIYTRLKM